MIRQCPGLIEIFHRPWSADDEVGLAWRWRRLGGAAIPMGMR